MKNFALILCLLVALGITSCNKAVDVDSGLPRITSISFIGIPAKDIEIDQINRTVTIRISDLLPSQGLVPTIETSSGAKVTQGLTAGGKLDLTPFCSCYSGPQSKPTSQLVLSQKNNGTGNELTSTYQVILSSPAQNLEPIPDVPITYSKIPDSDAIFINIHLPVRNLYRNPYVNAIFFKNSKTGVKSGYYLEGPNCINACLDTVANRMTIVYRTDVGTKLTTGTYEVSIRTADREDFIIFPQLFTYSE